MRWGYLAAITLTIVVAGCGATDTMSKQERQRATAYAVDSMLADRHYTVRVNTMHPMRGRSVSVSPDFNMRVSGDSLYCYLPYFGRAYSVPYNSREGALDFEAVVDCYTMEAEKRGGMGITFTTKSADDELQFRLTVFDNGNTSISIVPQRRDMIRFEGELVLP